MLYHSSLITPTVEPFNAGKRALKYLQHTKSLRLFLPTICNSTLVGETDALWSADVNDRRSTTGYYFKQVDKGGFVSCQNSRSNRQCYSHLVKQNTRVYQPRFQEPSSCLVFLENCGMNGVSPPQS